MGRLYLIGCVDFSLDISNTSEERLGPALSEANWTAMFLQ